LTVQSEHQKDDGVDFFVAVKEPDDTPSTKVFVVQVKGTMSSSSMDWTENVKQLFKKGGSPIYLPACVFVVNVRENATAYAWVAKPEVKQDAVSLNFYEHPEFHELNNEAVDQIISRVREWYESMPRSIAAQAS